MLPTTMETLARLAAEAAAEAATQFTTELQGANGLGHAMYNWSRKLKQTHPPFVSLPCASIVSHTPCEKPGTKVCTGCRLVSYCSRVSRGRALLHIRPVPSRSRHAQECQSAHWKRHKLREDLLHLNILPPHRLLDCKDDLLSSRWDPIWKARGYKPSFSADNDLARDNFKLSVTIPPCIRTGANFER